MSKIHKIIILLPSIKTGGGNRVMIELANELVARNIAIDIVYPNNSHEVHTFISSEKINFIPIGRFKTNKLHKLFNLIKVFRFINEHYTDEIIIATDPIMSIFLPLLKTKNIYRFIQANDYVIFDDLYILKNIFLLKIFKVLTKRSYYYAVGYLFNSIYTYERFIEVSARKDVPLAIVHPALNPKIFSNQNIRELNQINICIIARKHTWKGFVDFIKVYKDIQNMIKINNVYIISHDDLSEFDLSEVELIQPKSDHEIAHYMNKSHIFISTSWWEGFGLPPLEAMACGCSVILTDAGGVNEYAIPDKNCLMYKPKDVQKLQENILKLVVDKELRDYLSKNGEKKANEFSWEKSTDQLLKVLYGAP